MLCQARDRKYDSCSVECCQASNVRKGVGDTTNGTRADDTTYHKISILFQRRFSSTYRSPSTLLLKWGHCSMWGTN